LGVKAPVPAGGTLFINKKEASPQRSRGGEAAGFGTDRQRTSRARNESKVHHENCIKKKS